MKIPQECSGPLRIIVTAAEHLHSDMVVALPRSLELLSSRFPISRSPAALVRGLLGERSFPMLRMPFWIAAQGRRTGDTEFLRDVTYSTFSGFLFVRLVDDVMDGDGPPGQHTLLPVLGFFQSRFHLPYARHFDPDHPYWRWHYRAWDEHTDATTRDAVCEDISFETFMNTGSRKFSAAKIPVAAATMRFGVEESIPLWNDFIDLLGAYCQLANDLFDWHHDNRIEANTYVRSEWARRRADAESLGCWILREGFEWAEDLLLRWSLELEAHAAALDSTPAIGWMCARNEVLRRDLDGLRAGLAPVRAVYEAWKKQESSPLFTHSRGGQHVG